MSTDNNFVSQIEFIILCCKKVLNKNDIKAIRAKVSDIQNLENISMPEVIYIFKKYT